MHFVILVHYCCLKDGIVWFLFLRSLLLLLHTRDQQTLPETARVAQSLLHAYQDPPLHVEENPVINVWGLLDSKTWSKRFPSCRKTKVQRLSAKVAPQKSLYATHNRAPKLHSSMHNLGIPVVILIKGSYMQALLLTVPCMWMVLAVGKSPDLNSSRFPPVHQT